MGSTTDCDFPCGSSRSSLWMEMGCSTTEVILLPRGGPGGLWEGGTSQDTCASPQPGTDSNCLGSLPCQDLPVKTLLSFMPHLSCLPHGCPSTLHWLLSGAMPSLDLNATRSPRPELSQPAPLVATCVLTDPCLKPDRDRPECPFAVETCPWALEPWPRGERRGRGCFTLRQEPGVGQQREPKSGRLFSCRLDAGVGPAGQPWAGNLGTAIVATCRSPRVLGELGGQRLKILAVATKGRGRQKVLEMTERGEVP